MLPDIQDQRDERGIELDEVGISGLRSPVVFDDGTTRQAMIADFEVTVRLPHDRRGTHMSRMVQFVNTEFETFDPRQLPVALKAAADRFDVDALHIRLSGAFATQVTAPVSNEVSWQTHDVVVSGRRSIDDSQILVEVTSDVTSLCPCSKAISDYGAHNQRSKVTLAVIGSGDDPYPIDVATMVDLIRATGSCPVYPVVKRPDERAITMAAFDHPAFVEDMARDLSTACRDRGLVHRIAIRNLESIHSHDAICRKHSSFGDSSGQ